MVGLATSAPPAKAVPRNREARLFEGAPTLEDRIVAAWDELVASGTARCPVCEGQMAALDGCATCGSELS